MNRVLIYAYIIVLVFSGCGGGGSKKKPTSQPLVQYTTLQELENKTLELET